MIYPFNFSFSLSLLFMGFLLSNIFGILGNSKSIVFFFILCIELINCFVYTKETNSIYFRPLKGFLIRATPTKSTSPLRMVSNFLRLPVLIRSFPQINNKFDEQIPAVATPFLLNIKKFFISIFLRPFYEVDEKKQQNKNQNVFLTTYPFALQEKQPGNISIILLVLNFFKIGFEFGFFVDAFKLGS